MPSRPAAQHPDLASMVMELMMQKKLALRVTTKGETWACQFHERDGYVKVQETKESGASTPDSDASSSSSIRSSSSDSLSNSSLNGKGKERAH